MTTDQPRSGQTGPAADGPPDLREMVNEWYRWAAFARGLANEYTSEAMATTAAHLRGQATAHEELATQLRNALDDIDAARRDGGEPG